MNKVIDFLKAFDGGIIPVIYYAGEDDMPIWEGSLLDTPWWVADLELNYEGAEDGYPISFRDSLGKEYNDRPGLVIIVKED